MKKPSQNTLLGTYLEVLRLQQELLKNNPGVKKEDSLSLELCPVQTDNQIK